MLETSETSLGKRQENYENYKGKLSKTKKNRERPSPFCQTSFACLTRHLRAALSEGKYIKGNKKKNFHREHCEKFAGLRKQGLYAQRKCLQKAKMNCRYSDKAELNPED